MRRTQPEQSIALIDVWNVETFDAKLKSVLEAEADLIRNYETRERAIFEEHDLGRGGGRSLIRPDNQYAAAHIRLRERLGDIMKSRTIRAWHYTRLTDAEVGVIQRDGIHLSTPQTLRARLDTMVMAGAVSAGSADAIYDASPFHGDQLEARRDKFWMASHPLKVDDGGVELLLRHWGGEVSYFWNKDPDLLGMLAAVGKPRVIEIAVPLAQTRHSFAAGEAVLATVARALGCVKSSYSFDVYTKEPLPPASILAVHSDGDPTFAAIGVGYPIGVAEMTASPSEEIFDS